jgi:hypothetical protein
VIGLAQSRCNYERGLLSNVLETPIIGLIGCWRAGNYSTIQFIKIASEDATTTPKKITETPASS